MIRLNLQREPYWMDLPFTVRIRVRPMTTAIREQAVARGLRLAAELAGHAAAIEEAGGTVGDLPSLVDPDANAGLSQMLYAQGLAQAAILEWTGVMDEAGTAPALVNDQAVADMIAGFPAIADSFVAQYSAPMIGAIAEGNGFRSSPGGTSPAAPIIAEGAESRTSPAAGESDPAMVPTEAISAPTASTSP